MWVLQHRLKETDSIVWSGKSYHILCLVDSINLAVRDFLKTVKVQTLSEEVDLMAMAKPWNQQNEEEEEENQDNEDIEDYGRDEEELDLSDFENSNISLGGVIQKLRTIAKGINFPQSRVLTFQKDCDVANVQRMQLIWDQATRWSGTFNILERTVFLQEAIYI